MLFSHLFHGACIRNEKYAIYGNVEIGKVWKGSVYNMYYAVHVFFIRNYFIRNWASEP